MEDKIIKEAKEILDKICEKYKHHDKEIMQGVAGEKLHSLDVLIWIEKLNPHPSLALKLAALFHDIDRIVTPKVGGGFKGERNTKAYFEHKKKHAQRSADYIIPLLSKIVADKDIVKKTEFLIIHHDDNGRQVEDLQDLGLNYLVTADSFAFFTSIAPKLYAAEGKERIKDKIRFMIDKIPDFARKKLEEHQLENSIFNKFKNKIIKEYYQNN
ncbi:HD domain-containing protein [Patescibacteria group bacterium]|nr:HD domain-containing protein [Patescibacteria group bacterium]